LDVEEMTASPRVAVIISCYNDGRVALEAVASVEGGEPVELVVVDGSSSDRETLAILEELERDGVSVLRHGENLGLAAARNSGLEATSAPYVFPLDADDHAIPGALSAMADVLDADKDAAVCFGDYLEFGYMELVRAVPTRLDPYRLAYANEYPGLALFRRGVLEEVGGWRGAPGPAYVDWDLWMTMAERGCRAVHLGEGKLTFRRRLEGPSMNTAARKRHPELYDGLRREHSRLFEQLRDHRRTSDLNVFRKLLYPVIYGGRPRLAFEPKIKVLLDRAGIWTLRR
jgi:glycosyltransferase involved in cell wall biosynthesis